MPQSKYSTDLGFGAAPNKTVAVNPKYATARTKLNTGPNMRKVLQAAQGSGPNAHKKKADEYFVRLKPQTLGQLLEPLVESEENIVNLARDDTCSVVSMVADSASGAGSGEGNIIIFDLRPFDQFEHCHVYGARHLEVAQLKRSTNNLPRELYFFKGPVECDKMVVIYDEDGKAAPALGNLMVQQGVDNTYVVGGGFLGLCATCPHVLVGHQPTPDTLTSMMARAGLKMPTAGGSVSGRSQAGAMSGRCSTAGSVRTQATNLLSSVGGSPGRAWK